MVPPPRPWFYMIQASQANPSQDTSLWDEPPRSWRGGGPGKAVSEAAQLDCIMRTAPTPTRSCVGLRFDGVHCLVSKLAKSFRTRGGGSCTVRGCQLLRPARQPGPSGLGSSCSCQCRRRRK